MATTGPCHADLHADLTCPWPDGAHVNDRHPQEYQSALSAANGGITPRLEAAIEAMHTHDAWQVDSDARQKLEAVGLHDPDAKVCSVGFRVQGLTVLRHVNRPHRPVSCLLACLHACLCNKKKAQSPSSTHPPTCCCGRCPPCLEVSAAGCPLLLHCWVTLTSSS